MPVRPWASFLVGMFLFGALIQAPVLVTLSVTFGVILAAAGWWRRHALDGVRYRRRFHYRRGFPGEQTRLQIEIENRKLLPVSWLRSSDPWPLAAAPDDPSALAPSHLPDRAFLTHHLSLRWYERVRRSYTLTFHKRGYYPVGPLQLSSGDLFGMYEQRQEVAEPEALTVFPELLPFSSLKLPPEDPFGDRRARRRIYEDPNLPMGSREYRPEDGFRQVHWPATARTGELQAKVYQPVSARVLMICLNVATYPHYWEGVYPALLEQLLRVAATLCSQGIQEGYSVGLISNGCLAHADKPFRLLPGRSVNQLGRLLQALAEVTPFMTAPFESYLLKAMPDIPYGASVVVVTGRVSLELCETLLRLRQYRRQMTLISLEEQPPPPLPEIRVSHLPFREGE